MQCNSLYNTLSTGVYRSLDLVAFDVAKFKAFYINFISSVASVLYSAPSSKAQEQQVHLSYAQKTFKLANCPHLNILWGVFLGIIVLHVCIYVRIGTCCLFSRSNTPKERISCRKTVVFYHTYGRTYPGMHLAIKICNNYNNYWYIVACSRHILSL